MSAPVDVLAIMDRLLECASIGVDADDPLRQMIEAGHEARAAVAELIEAAKEVKADAEILGMEIPRLEAALARCGGAA